jgi:hypothetical protein
MRSYILILVILFLLGCESKNLENIRRVERALGININYPILNVNYELIRQDINYINPFIVLMRINIDSCYYIKLVESIGLVKNKEEKADSLLCLNQDSKNIVLKNKIWSWRCFNESAFPALQKNVSEVSWWIQKPNEKILFTGFYDDKQSPKISHCPSIPKGRVISTYFKNYGYFMIETDMGSDIGNL